MIIAISGLCTDESGASCNAGSGKSTVADLLVKNHGFVNVGHADPFKRFVQEVFAFSDDQVWGSTEKRNEPDVRYRRTPTAGQLEDNVKFLDQHFLSPVLELDYYLTPRYALQRIGSEWGRDCYKHTWTDLLIRTAKQIATGNYLYDAKSGLRQAIVPADFEGMVRTKTDVVASDLRFKNEMERLRFAGAYIVRVRRPVLVLPTDPTHQSERDLADVPDSKFDYVLDNDCELSQLPGRVAFLADAARAACVPPMVMGVDPAHGAVVALLDSRVVPEGTLLKGLLESREADVAAGLIQPTTMETADSDVPPFMRKR